MPIPSRATLKSYFETNDQPTEAQFAALIDAIYDLAQEAADSAADDVAAGFAALVPFTARAHGAVSLTVAGVGYGGTVIHNAGCVVTINFVSELSLSVTATFDDALADTNYTVLAFAARSSGGETYTPTITRNVGSVVFNFTIANTGGVTRTFVFNLAVFK